MGYLFKHELSMMVALVCYVIDLISTDIEITDFNMFIVVFSASILTIIINYALIRIAVEIIDLTSSKIKVGDKN